MKEHYLITVENPADVCLLEINGTSNPRDPRVITWILVPESHAGQGYGSRLLEECLEDADREKVTLTLGAVPVGSHGLCQEALIQWYKRHGFEEFEGEREILIRTPK